jgi:hypothetical protein
MGDSIMGAVLEDGPLSLVALAELRSGEADSAAARVVGGMLGRASKMPGTTFGLSALDCGVGGRLRAVDGSICEHCYAMGGHYMQDNVRSAHARRLDALGDPDWPVAMAWLINRAEGPDSRSKHACGHHRWHDSGDLQSVEHLQAICDAAALTPDVAHWIPTRETGIVREYLQGGGKVPANLNIRVSNHMVGETFDERPLGLPYSTVGCDSGEAHQCPSLDQGNSCGDCRACWDPEVEWVNYRLH